MEIKFLIADDVNGVMEMSHDEFMLEHAEQDLLPNMYMFYESLPSVGEDELVAVSFHPGFMPEHEQEFYDKIKSEYGIR